MSLTASYQNFLRKPSEAALAPDAALNYISTLTTFHEAAGVVKHLSRQQGALKKKREVVLSAIEGDGSICSEIETTLEFVNGGGAYLPGLDDNFLADQTVTLPIVHVVQFNQNGKISQIRLYWDQGALLKAVDVIGARGKNWPLKDSKDHAKLISTSVAAAGKGNGAQKKWQGDVVITSMPSSPRKNGPTYPVDSQALLERHANEQVPIVASKSASFKQPNVEYGELLAGAESDMATEAGSRTSSPTKQNFDDITPKGGAGKNFQPSRLFDSDALSSTASERHMKPHPGKYDHFEFDDGEGQPLPRQPTKQHANMSKHASQWGFEDFTTPVKLPPRPNKNAPHFHIGEADGRGDDDADADADATPVNKPGRGGLEYRRRAGHPQFELQDDGTTPEGGRRPAGHPRGRGDSNVNTTAYRNKYFDDDGDESEVPREQQAKKRDDGASFRPAVKSTERSKDVLDPSSSPPSSPPDRPLGIRTAGNGMGARKDGNEFDPVRPMGIRTAGNGMGAPKGSAAAAAAQERGGFGKENVNVGIKTAGDGMGGRSGAGRSWGFGDESEEEGFGGGNFGTGKARGAMNGRQGLGQGHW